MNAYLMLGAAIVCEVFGTTMLKYSGGFSKWGFACAGLAAFGVAFFLVARVFETLPMGLVYATWSGCGIILTLLIGWLLGQRPDWPAVIGVVLIIAGVLVINLLSKTSAH
ncbi:SMR family transporter [Bergeriella denitrificans]|uniref:Putative small multidrug resistance protein n=1 Tax=Bergeriella denitrificans TaxID=494 RepID=A0A378UKN8_BERDE|nr:SMR family transporter [Bergeriella denitrificans]STZ77061.1 putative small multidrug resistance protein [Bergeriella denitrificans]